MASLSDHQIKRNARFRLDQFLWSYDQLKYINPEYGKLNPKAIPRLLKEVMRTSGCSEAIAQGLIDSAIKSGRIEVLSEIYPSKKPITKKRGK